MTPDRERREAAAAWVAARGRLLRRWREGRGPDAWAVHAYDLGDDRCAVVIVSPSGWAAYEATAEDLEAIADLARRRQLYNAACVVGDLITEEVPL